MLTAFFERICNGAKLEQI